MRNVNILSRGRDAEPCYAFTDDDDPDGDHHLGNDEQDLRS